jgi:lysophospholipase L1-like esterase
MTTVQPNTAVLPVPNTQQDFYDWADRHARKQALARTGQYELIFIGDSITHLFEEDGRGAAVWEQYYGQRRALNLGYGWDCTQNVLWRLVDGEFAGQHPKLVVLNIGTNNLTGNSTCRANTAEEIVEGIFAICRLIHEQSADTAILLMAVFPRGLTTDPIHARVQELNATLQARLPADPRLLFLDIGGKFLGPDGEIPVALMNDRCHPTADGYPIWAAAIEPIVAHYVG